MNYRVDLMIGVETDLDTHLVHNGIRDVPVGWTTADGRSVKPYVTFEIEEHDGSHRDLQDDELEALGITYEYGDTPTIIAQDEAA